MQVEFTAEDLDNLWDALWLAGEAGYRDGVTETEVRKGVYRSLRVKISNVLDDPQRFAAEQQ
jgi:hypothetical protein